MVFKTTNIEIHQNVCLNSDKSNWIHEESTDFFHVESSWNWTVGLIGHVFP